MNINLNILAILCTQITKSFIIYSIMLKSRVALRIFAEMEERAKNVVVAGNAINKNVYLCNYYFALLCIVI